MTRWAFGHPTPTRWAQTIKERNAAATVPLTKARLRQKWLLEMAEEHGYVAAGAFVYPHLSNTPEKEAHIYRKVREAAHWGRLALKQDDLC